MKFQWDDVSLDACNVFCVPNYIREPITNPTDQSLSSQLTISTFGPFSGLAEVPMFEAGYLQNYLEYHQTKKNDDQVIA